MSAKIKNTIKIIPSIVFFLSKTESRASCGARAVGLFARIPLRALLQLQNT
jgi:hypothetical protein